MSGTSTDSFDVECTVIDAFAEYTSDPAPGNVLNFGTVINGVTSGALGIAVENTGIGPSPQSDLNITGVNTSSPVFSFTVNNAGPFLVGGAPVVDAITVTCTPDTTGVINGTLTVITNAANEPMGGFQYDLQCEGLPDGDFDSNPPPGGTLNLGIVEPETPTFPGDITFFNNGSFDDIELTCSFDDPSGVFTIDPDPPEFTIPAGTSAAATFQCVPPTSDQFSATLSCGVSGDVNTQAVEYTITCQGQPLIVPTLNRWGLIALALVLLLVGGLAGRRMIGQS